MAILRFKDSSSTWSVAGDGVGGGSIDRTVILSAANWSSSAPLYPNCCDVRNFRN